MVKNKIEILQQLAQLLQNKDNADWALAKKKAEINNKWFSQEFIDFATQSIIEQFLAKEKLENWIAPYDISSIEEEQNIGLILAGNLPLVGFQDILACYILNLPTQIKLSSKDVFLNRYIIETLQSLDKNWEVNIVEQLKGFSKVIATGSNNTNRYFEYYFKSVPALLRQNRSSVAILDGTESEEELQALADDIFLFFGQGCRNISKLFVPKGYVVKNLFPYFEKYAHLHQHKLYMDNYDYTRTLYLMNQTPHFANNFLMLKEDNALTSRLATIHYSFYENQNEVKDYLQQKQDDIQCVVSKPNNLWQSFAFGEAQKPKLSNYADNIDTIAFLLK